jgi:hypothetical protein
MSHSALEITVIYPMIELRRHREVISPLRSWTQEQTCARDRYRVIAAFAEDDREQAAAMGPLLGPDDELLAVPDGGFAALVNAAVARARTPWLVLTEGHCVAQPDCLDAAMRWIEANPDGQIGNFGLTHLNDGVVTGLVARWFDDTLAQWRTPTNWQHAISGGFAIRASLFDEVEAMEPAFGPFSPHVQSARLHSRGTQVESVPGARAIHWDEASMAEFYDSTARYARGELVARTRLDAAFMERYFGEAYHWSNQLRLRRGTVLAMARGVIAAGRTDLGKSAALAGVFVRLLGEAIAGLRPRIAINRLVLALDAIAVERLPIPNEWRWRRFLRSHRRVVHLTQLEWLLSNSLPPTTLLSEGRWAIEQLGPNDIVGVHGLEEFDGRRFRWTESVAMIRMAPPPTPCELTIETGALRGDPLSSLIAVTVAGRALPRKYCTSDGKGTLAIFLPAPSAAAAKDGIVLVCTPLLPAREGTSDQRALGLPIISIAIRPSKGAS